MTSKPTASSSALFLLIASFAAASSAFVPPRGIAGNRGGGGAPRAPRPAPFAPRTVVRASADDADGAASLWRVLGAAPSPAEAWTTVFGERGARGEYMDGYPARAMAGRCAEDYGWAGAFAAEEFAAERAAMMSRLYNDERLWEHVCMVAFAEHYVLVDDDCEAGIGKPFETFQRQRELVRPHRKIFSGVVLRDWEAPDVDGIDRKLSDFKEKGVDYVRLECNFGSVEEIGGAARLADDPMFSARFDQLAGVAKRCQDRGLVPLVLLQVPWREPGESSDYFASAVKCFAAALRGANAESRRLLLETRPPVGLSAREERGLSGTDRTSLGLATGRGMFDAIDEAFGGDTIAGFCVAGGSTKGDVPTAMEDDTQDAVRQGIRERARRKWDYDVCFWEMGAKLMLQPEVGRLWGDGGARRNAACELFRANAEALAEEIARRRPV